MQCRDRHQWGDHVGDANVAGALRLNVRQQHSVSGTGPCSRASIERAPRDRVSFRRGQHDLLRSLSGRRQSYSGARSAGTSSFADGSIAVTSRPYRQALNAADYGL
jgi:hypothetical protein